jgi:TRAP-type uncharacterized transport system substrate-binding protein
VHSRNCIFMLWRMPADLHVAATALLVATAGMPDSAIEGLLQQVYGGIDFLQAGSAAGSLIARTTARVGLTLPLHPAAERFLLRPVATQ